MHKFLRKLSRPLKLVIPLRPSMDEHSAVTDRFGFKVRPHISLKARMLGGQAETVMRLRGLER